MAIGSEVEGPRTFLAIVCITLTVLQGLILSGNWILGRDMVAVVHITEVTAL